MNRLLNKFKNAFIITSRQRKLILWVFWLSIYRNLLLLWRSKEAFSEHIHKKKKGNAVLTTDKISIAKDITLAIHVANKVIPWKNVCRHQSWQAVYLLLHYQIPFEYFVGIEKLKTIKEGHSWVKVNQRFICGKCNISDYSIVLN